MIKIEKIEVSGWEAAIRGMRNPMNSWNKSDSHQCLYEYDECIMVALNHEPVSCIEPENFRSGRYCIGVNDMDLMRRLLNAGPEHRKYLRMIHASLDITAPLYWWKEYDTYKIGTTANSCSTMHKIAARPFVLDDFSTDHLTHESLTWMKNTVIELNYWRDCYLDDHDKESWWQMIQLLPSSYNQRRTVDFDYETAMAMIRQRTGHKLDEWNVFVETLKHLPYMEDLTNGKEGRPAESTES